MKVSVARIKTMWMVFPSKFFSTEDLVSVHEREINNLEEFNAFIAKFPTVNETTFGYQSTRELVKRGGTKLHILLAH